MLAPLTESERAEIPSDVDYALRAAFASLPVDVVAAARAGLTRLLIDAAVLTVVRTMRGLPPEVTARAVRAGTIRSGIPEPDLCTALAGLAVLRGCMAEGYTSEQVNRVFRPIAQATGYTVVCVWDYLDGGGFAGDSQFYLRTMTGSLFETNGQFWTWLSGDPACLATPASPGEPSTWFAGLPEPWTTSDLGFHDEEHNYARYNKTEDMDRQRDHVRPT